MSNSINSKEMTPAEILAMQEGYELNIKSQPKPKKFCPLMCGGEDYAVCGGKDCGWWDESSGMCSVANISSYM